MFLGRVVIHDQVDIQIMPHGVDVIKSEMYLENGCRRHLDSYQRGFGASIAATGDPTSRLRCSCCFMVSCLAITRCYYLRMSFLTDLAPSLTAARV